MIKKWQTYFQTINKQLVNDAFRYHLEMILFPTILTVVSLFMTLLNVFTHKTALMISTLLFAIISGTCAILTWKRPANQRKTECLFFVSLITMFTFFLITGGTENFSPIWICILPSCGLSVLGKRKGTILSLVQFVIVLLLLDTPLGDLVLRTEYTVSFRMRFPLLYVSAYIIGYFTEHIRLLTNNARLEIEEQYRKLAVTDMQTELYNRLAFNTRLTESCKEAVNAAAVGLILIDIDDFRDINDTFGHEYGDEMIHQFAVKLIPLLTKDAFTARWGEDAFVILLSGECSKSFLSVMCNHIQNGYKEPLRVKDRDIKINMTIAATSTKGGSVLDSNVILNKTEKLLHQAKKEAKGSFMVA